MGWQRPTLLQPVKLRPLVAVNPRSRKSSERIEIKQLHRQEKQYGTEKQLRAGIILSPLAAIWSAAVETAQNDGPHSLQCRALERMWAHVLSVICSNHCRHSRQDFRNRWRRLQPALTTKGRGLPQTRIRVL